MLTKLNILITFGLLLSFFLLPAQDIGNEDEVIYKAVEISEIPDYNTSIRNRVLVIKQQIVDSNEWSQFQKDYDAIVLTYGKLNAIFDSVDVNSLTLGKLDSWHGIWNEILNDLNLIYDPVASKESEYLNLYSELNLTYNILLETILETKNTSLPDDVKQNLNETKKIVRDTRKIVKGKHSNYLTFKSICSTLSNKVFQKQARIKKAKENIMKNLLVPEQQVLWKAFVTNKADTIKFKNNALVEFQENTQSYLKQFKGLIVIIVIILIFFISLFYYIKRAVKKSNLISDIVKDKAMRVILFRPLIAGFVFTWILTLLIFDFPSSLSHIWNLLMIPVVLYLLLDLFGKRPLSTILIFLFFYIFRNIEFLFDSSTPINRVAYLLITVFLTFVVVRILRKGNFDLIKSKWRFFVRFVFNSLFVLLITTFFFNIAGNVVLADIILVGSIEVVLSGIVLLASFVILEAFIKLIMILPKLQYSYIIRNHSNEIKKIIRSILVLIFVITWLNASLNNYGVQSEVYEWIKDLFSKDYIIGTISFSLSNVVAFFITIYVTVQISKAIRLFLNEEIFERKQTPKGASGTIILLVRFTITSLGFLMALAFAGIGLENITIVISALGVGIGFGLQNIFNNLISGLILAFERPIKVDDIIQVGELMGVVKEIGFRASTVRTYDGSEVIVPNGDIISNQMINWTLSDRKRRLRVDLSLAMDTKPEDVIELLNEVTNESEQIVNDPAPRPRFVGYEDGMQSYQYLFWIADLDNSFSAGTATMVHIHNKLKEKGIEVPYPQRNIKIFDENNLLKGSK